LRRLDKDWITRYIDYVGPVSESPRRYHFWSAATIIAASLKRHAWYEKGNSNIYPNTYTVLVGRPGVGKGQAIIPAVAALDKSGTANILSDRLTMPFILEELSKGFSSTLSSAPGAISIGIDHSGLIVADELQVFASTGEDVISNLTALWDSREHAFGYGTRTKGKASIDKPSVSFLAGTTPSWLVRSIPVAAIGGGFTRRVNFVFSKEAHKDKPFPCRNHSNLHDNLVNDLRHIASNIGGCYTLSAEARPLYAKCYAGCVVGELEDEATGTYKDSAWVHVIKLAMAVQASMDDSLEISAKAWEIAETEINQIVTDIATVFRGVGLSDLTVAADRLMSYLEVTGYATRKQIQRMMWQYAMSPDVEIILRTLEESDMIICCSSGHGEQVYKVMPKAPPAKGGKP
jgi:hypothetical protein